MENKQGLAKSWKVKAEEQKGKLPGTNHMVLSDVCVCACVLSVWILVLSGSLRVYSGKWSQGEGAKWWRGGGPKPVDRSYHCHPHILRRGGCYLEPFAWTVMVISLHWAQHWAARSLKSLKRRQSETGPLDSDLSVIRQNSRTCWRKQHPGGGTGSGRRAEITLWLD